MAFNIGFIKAETHTPEYLMHKYWARKPHNVISQCINALTNEEDTVVDPFCGSGVTIREGALIGRKCIGFDLNPVAVLISRVLLDPPETEAFLKVFNEIYDKVYSEYGYLYQTKDGKNVKYVSHRIIARCGCGKVVKREECKKKGRNYLCPHCGNVVRFNLESLIDTEIFNITVENDKAYKPSSEEMERQKELSSYSDASCDSSAYDFEFPENRRILAFKGIRTSSFFTKRNFCILSFFANEIWKIEDNKIRDCSLLLLTSSAAQCSRLIANRNNLSTGGPAWSVPGFWIPQEHLETNPFVHFKARIGKFGRALKCLAASPVKTPASIYEGNSLELLNSSDFADLKADLIFLDPPYGDSVPYTEFSNIWNSFLKKIPLSDEDISVSDRMNKAESWANYGEKLDEYMACFTKHLTIVGKLLITFNNNDMRAWESLISALQNNGFICRSVFYQIPAVISSKAHMSINSSYISDVYSVYTYEPETKISKDLSPLLSHLCFVANSRGGEVSKTVLNREFIISWLKNNIDHELLKTKDNIIASVFDFDKKAGIYTIKTDYRKKVPQLSDAVRDDMNKIIKTGAVTVLDGYLKACADCEKYGTMELWEFKKYIEDFAIEDGKIYGYTQMSLFDLPQ